MRTRRRTVVSLGLAALFLAATACATGAGADAPDSGVGPSTPDAAVADPDGLLPAKRSVVILMVGDGMGRPQIEAASLTSTGTTDGLHMQSLPNRGSVRTASLSGITDSAAAATAMASGVKTLNGRIGMDRNAQPVQTLIERAHSAGMAAGIVTTTSLPHATPGAFSAHRATRDDYVNIAADQVRLTQPDVMLGGGTRYFLPAGSGSERDDDGLIQPLVDAGYHIVHDAAALAAFEPAAGTKLFGSFADEHMTYSLDRAADSTEPTLAEMSMAAIRQLDHNDKGFFLVIEGGRIDHAGHGNDLANNVGETLAFDEAIAAVHAWQLASDADVTLVITADHECGGMTIIAPPAEAGALPSVSWRRDQHTNTRVDVFAAGKGTDTLDGRIVDHTDIHALLAARIDRTAVVDPVLVLTPDGSLSDLRYRVVDQAAETGFGIGYNQLDSLHIDASERGLAIGVEGVFEWSANAMVILVDVDYGSGTGVTAFPGSLSDNDGRVDSILSSLGVDASAHAGFGADFALVVWGGSDPHLEDLVEDAGLRGLGQPDDLPWLGAATNFGEGVRASGAPIAAVEAEGFETLIPWQALYETAIPAGATIALAVVLVNDDGGYGSNQALPPFAAGTPNPGRTSYALPGVAVVPIDVDGDALVDNELAPFITP